MQIQPRLERPGNPAGKLEMLRARGRRIVRVPGQPCERHVQPNEGLNRPPHTVGMRTHKRAASDSTGRADRTEGTSRERTDNALPGEPLPVVRIEPRARPRKRTTVRHGITEEIASSSPTRHPSHGGAPQPNRRDWKCQRTEVRRAEPHSSLDGWIHAATNAPTLELASHPRCRWRYQVCILARDQQSPRATLPGGAEHGATPASADP